MVKFLMQDSAAQTLAGIVFQSNADDNTLSNDLSYKLRFPSKTRSGGDEWFTENMYPAFSRPGPRQKDKHTGGVPSKYRNDYCVGPSLLWRHLVDDMEF